MEALQTTEPLLGVYFIALDNRLMVILSKASLSNQASFPVSFISTL